MTCGSRRWSGWPSHCACPWHGSSRKTQHVVFLPRPTLLGWGLPRPRPPEPSPALALTAPGWRMRRLPMPITVRTMAEETQAELDALQLDIQEAYWRDPV